MPADVDVADVGFAPTSARPVREVDSRRARCIGMSFAGAICLTYVLVNPPSQDFASGHFRAELASRGVYLWNNLPRVLRRLAHPGLLHRSESSRHLRQS